MRLTMICRRVLLIVFLEILASVPEEVMRLGVDGVTGAFLNNCSPRRVDDFNAVGTTLMARARIMRGQFYGLPSA